MDTVDLKEKIKKMYLEDYKNMHKTEERIALFERMINELKDKNLPAYRECFYGYLERFKKNYEKAVKYFKHSIELDGELAYAWHGLGTVYFEQDKYEKAIECHNKALELDAGFVYPLVGLGAVYKEKKDYEKAIAYFSRAIECDGNDVYPWNALGNIYFAEEDFNKAGECYREALKIEQNYVYTWNALANLYRKTKNFEMAIEHCRQAIEIDGNYAYPWNTLGNIHSEKGDIQKTIDCYNKAIEIDKDFAHPWNGLGNVFSGRKNYKKAREAYQKAVEIDKNYAYPWNGLGNIYYQEKNYEKAIDCYNKAIEIDKDLAHPFNALGNIYMDVKNYEEAKGAYRRAIEIDKNYAYPWNGLGNVYFREKNYEKAMDCYNKAIAIDKNFSFPWNGLGDVHAEKKEYEKAIENYEKALQLDEQFAYPWNGLGNLYSEKKDYERALACYNKAIEIDANLPHPWNGLGVVYSALNDAGKAEEYYNKAISHDENFPYPWLNLGIDYLEKKEYENAKRHFEKALNLFAGLKDNYMVSIVEQNLENTRNLSQSQEILEAQLPPVIDPITKVLKATRDQRIEAKALENQKKFLQFIEEKRDVGVASDEYFLVLRRWNSYTPIIADNYHISKGGGYFFKCGGKGIVMDPGFNFIDNFKNAKHSFHEIDIILISHAHNDHTADLESILTLLYRYNKEIMDSEDANKDNTIRREIARQKNCSVDMVTIEEIEEKFLESRRRKIIHFYMTISVFKKFSGLFRLFSKNDYRIHIIERGDKIKINDKTFFEVIPAHHHDIISDQESVGFLADHGDTAVIYTGDTRWNKNIEDVYKEIFQRYEKKYRVLVAHLGGFKKNEQNYLVSGFPKEKAFYSNHLGRLGLVKVNEILQPDICFISEFGEELKGSRRDISNIMRDAFNNKVLFFPADIGLTFNLENKTIEAITGIDHEEHKSYKSYIKPEEVETCLLRKDYSLHYYKRNADFTESDLKDILFEEQQNNI